MRCFSKTKTLQSLKRCFFIVLLAKVIVLLVVCAAFALWQVPDISLVQDRGPCYLKAWSSDESWDNATRLILFWTTFFSYRDFAWGYGHEPFVSRRCPVQNCLTTSDREQLSRADAVVFHVRDVNPYDLPPVRYTCQRYVFFLYESPAYTYLNLASFGNFFNWTMTYRFDSDIPPVIHLVPANRTMPVINHAANKTRLAVWLVSNCWTHSHRERYVRELQRYIPVDIYGECGMQSSLCSTNVSLRHCYEAFEQRYKFYFSFENSLCADYFSEKLYNIYAHDMVPVVLGKANYTQFAPPHSLIDASEFASPRDLADHLLRVAADDRLYGEYFEWKRHAEFAINTIPWCDLCAKLNRRDEPPKTYADIENWWVDGSNCTSDFVGRWRISTWWDRVMEAVSQKYLSLKHHAKLFLHNYL